MDVTHAAEVPGAGNAGMDSQERRAIDQPFFVKLEPPRFEEGRALLIAGLKGRYCGHTRTEISSLWERFLSHIGNIKGQVGYKAYGVVFNCDAAGNFDYMPGVEVATADRLPPGFSTVFIPKRSYMVFRHRGPVSEIHRTADAIWNGGVRESGYMAADAPHFELYPEDFNPVTDQTGAEIWIPKGDKR